METRIFFSPGDSVASIHSYNEAIRKRRTFKQARHNDKLVIIKDPNDKEYAIFYAKDALPTEYEKSKPCEIKDRL